MQDSHLPILFNTCATDANLIVILFAVVAGVMSITNHCLFGTPLKLTYPSLPDQQAIPSPSRIWLTEVPSVLVNEIEYLKLLLERIVGEELPFSLTEVNGTTLLIEFSEDVHLSERGTYICICLTAFH